MRAVLAVVALGWILASQTMVATMASSQQPVPALFVCEPKESANALCPWRQIPRLDSACVEA